MRWLMSDSPLEDREFKDVNTFMEELGKLLQNKPDGRKA